MEQQRRLREEIRGERVAGATMQRCCARPRPRPPAARPLPLTLSLSLPLSACQGERETEEALLSLPPSGPLSFSLAGNILPPFSRTPSLPPPLCLSCVRLRVGRPLPSPSVRRPPAFVPAGREAGEGRLPRMVRERGGGGGGLALAPSGYPPPPHRPTDIRRCRFLGAVPGGH